MGRHSAPDDDTVSDTASETAVAAIAVAAPPAPAGPSPRPRPGRHSRPDEESGSESLSDFVGAPVGERRTDTIERIADPVLDEPLPVAETTVIAAVREGDLFGDLVDAPPVESIVEPSAAPPDAVAEPAGNRSIKAARQPKPSKTPKPVAPKRPEPHVSDRALLRADPAARARVIAAVVVPFVLYVVVLLALDALDVRTLLIWIWVPLVTAGVVAGLLLDLAHRAAAETRQASAPTD